MVKEKENKTIKKNFELIKCIFNGRHGLVDASTNWRTI